VYLAIDPSDGGPAAYAVAACQFYPEGSEEYETGADSESVFGERLDYCHVFDLIYIPGGTSEIAIAAAMGCPWWDNIAGGATDDTAPDEKKRWAMAGVSLTSKKIPVHEGERRLHTFLHGAGDYRPHLLLSPTLPGMAISEFHKYRSTVETSLDADNSPSRATRNRAGPNHMLNALWYLLVARYGYVKGKKRAVIVRDHIRRLFGGNHVQQV
jgi:hypothetical protein